MSVDFEEYSKLVRALASLSGLFTASGVPYIDSKFVEHLYARTSNAENYASLDMSFDALLPSGSGIGVKTFRAPVSMGSKKEKIAEFPRAARELELHKLSGRELATAVALLRNKRVSSDCAEYNIRLSGSLYHCLIRSEGGFFVHEEPYSLIHLDEIVPTNARGNPERRWASAGNHVHFADGINSYTYNITKNVLFKSFDLNQYSNSPVIPVSISRDPFKVLLQLGIPEVGLPPSEPRLVDRIILPLYSNRRGEKFVFPKSGINQWNAGGRQRNFGEAYIPVPRVIHKLHPGFFPPTEESFTLQLPNGSAVSAKICQAGGKALMSDPNVDLMSSLFASLDGSREVATRRLDDHNPYTYSDLVESGKDCVEIVRLQDGDYRMTMRPVGEFEAFISSADDEAIE